MTLRAQVTLYTMAEAINQVHRLKGWDYTEEGLRGLLRRAGLPIYRVGNLDLVAETDLLRLIQLPRPKRGRRGR